MSDEVILRLVEMDGKQRRMCSVKFAGPIAAAREVNGQEQPVGAAQRSRMAPWKPPLRAYQPRTFALRLERAAGHVAPVQSQPVRSDYDLAAASNDDTNIAAGFDGKGDALPAEMLPADLNFNGVAFHLAPAATGKPDAVIAKGQTIQSARSAISTASICWPLRRMAIRRPCSRRVATPPHSRFRIGEDLSVNGTRASGSPRPTR